jgi:Na+/melibiose symporter-like transporter
LPLAAAALPVHVYVPKLYAGLGMELAVVGLLLLAVRMLDAVSDPLLGALADRIPRRLGGRKAMIAAALPPLAAGFWLLFHPPQPPGLLAAWLAGSLVLAYIGLSAASIGHFALGSALSRDYAERTRITAARGVAALAGVLCAAVVPELLVREHGAVPGLAAFAGVYLPVLAAASLVTLAAGPAAPPAAVRAVTLQALLLPLRNPRFRRLALVFLVNGIAAGIPATLLLFFVADVLQRPELTALFLLLYFAAGAAGMPAWVLLASRAGKVRAWFAAMAMAATAFVWAFFIGPGDAVAFAVICLLSGLAFGADLALPASLLADVIDDDDREGGRPDGTYFGIWHLLEKLALALAAGLALPLLQWLGYDPGLPAEQGSGLSWIYALLPCAVKLVAALLLWRSGLERGRAAWSWKGVQA